MSEVVRRLLLLRHAHAGSGGHGPDIERKLTERGVLEAGEIGEYMAEEGLMPDLAVISSAQRTRETWINVQKQLPTAIQCIYDLRIYDASQPTLLEVLAAQPAASRTVLLLGHNPGMQELALHLTGRGSKNAVVRLRHEYPPASLAMIEFEQAGDWVQIADHAGVLERFITPSPVG